MEIPPAPYLPTSDPQVVESTPLSQSGWYEDGQHGGLVAGLLARAVEAVPTLTPMEVARLTVDIFRVVPTVPLRVATSILREGKRIQLVRAHLSAGDTQVAQATALRLRVADRPRRKPPCPIRPCFRFRWPRRRRWTWSGWGWASEGGCISIGTAWRCARPRVSTTGPVRERCG